MGHEWNLVDVEDEVTIPFNWKDQTPGGRNLGRAEFVVCLKFSDGRVSEFWVYPVQTRLETAWHYCGLGDTQFTVTSLGNLDSAKIWCFFHCAVHETTSFRVYSPNNAKYLRIDEYGLTFLEELPNAIDGETC